MKPAAPVPPPTAALILGVLAAGYFSLVIALSERLDSFPFVCTTISLVGLAFTVASIRRWRRSGAPMTTRFLALLLVALLLNLTTGALFLIDYYLVPNSLFR